MNSEEYQPTLCVLDLMGELRRLLVAQRRADRLICRYLADLADTMPTWPGSLFYENVEHLVRARFGLSIRSTRERLRVGRALRTLPALDAALEAGTLNYSRVREATRVAKPDSERYWLHAAQRLSMRALERQVANSGGGGAARPRRRSGSSLRQSISDDVWGLLERAMQAAKRALGTHLSDAEALVAVAQGAIAHYGGSPADARRHPATQSGSSAVQSKPSRMNDSEIQSVSTASETRQVGEQVSDGEPTQSGLAGGAVGAKQVRTSAPTQSGSATSLDLLPPTGADPNLAEVPIQTLSPDEQVIFDRICTDGPWNHVALCDVTGIPPNRFACALFDLIVQRRLVRRTGFGLYEAWLKDPVRTPA